MPRRISSLLVNASLSVAVTLLFAGGLEGFFRWRERVDPPPRVEDYIWDWREKWDGDFYKIRSDGNGWPPWEEVNADGVRDRTHSPEKPEGVARLAFIGDSVTVGHLIKAHQAYPQVLQARLEERGVPVEVFNVALWGWSTRQERMAYRSMVRKYSPDVVALGICLNDIPELQNNLARPPGWLTALHERSALVRGVVNARGREIQSVEQLFTDADSPRVKEAFARFFDEVTGLRREVEADGGTLALVVFPFRFQLAPGAPAPVPQERIVAFCREQGLRCLDTLPAIRRLGEAAFVDYDHFSPAGSEAVADVLLASDIVPRPRGFAERLPGGASAATGELMKLLREGNDDMRPAAAWALARRGAAAAEATDALVAALGDARAEVRREASRALGLLAASLPAPRRAAVRDALFAALGDRSQPVRWAAALSSFQLGLEVGEVDRLVALLRHEDGYVRGFAAFGLGTLGPAARSAVPALVGALSHPEGYARGGAIMALAKMGPDAAAAVPALLRALQEPEGDHRWKAARTLGRIGPPAAPAVPALVRALDDPHEYVRAHAARALGRIAPGDHEVAKALSRAARGDGDSEVRREALAALEQRPTAE